MSAERHATLVVVDFVLRLRSDARFILLAVRRIRAAAKTVQRAVRRAVLGRNEMIRDALDREERAPDRGSVWGPEVPSREARELVARLLWRERRRAFFFQWRSWRRRVRAVERRVTLFEAEGEVLLHSAGFSPASSPVPQLPHGLVPVPPPVLCTPPPRPPSAASTSPRTAADERGRERGQQRLEKLTNIRIQLQTLRSEEPRFSFTFTPAELRSTWLHHSRSQIAQGLVEVMDAFGVETDDPAFFATLLRRYESRVRREQRKEAAPAPTPPMRVIVQDVDAVTPSDGQPTSGRERVPMPSVPSELDDWQRASDNMLLFGTRDVALTESTVSKSQSEDLRTDGCRLRILPLTGVRRAPRRRWVRAATEQRADAVAEQLIRQRTVPQDAVSADPSEPATPPPRKRKWPRRPRATKTSRAREAVHAADHCSSGTAAGKGQGTAAGKGQAPLTITVPQPPPAPTRAAGALGQRPTRARDVISPRHKGYGDSERPFGLLTFGEFSQLVAAECTGARALLQKAQQVEQMRRQQARAAAQAKIDAEISAATLAEEAVPRRGAVERRPVPPHAPPADSQRPRSATPANATLMRVRGTTATRARNSCIAAAIGAAADRPCSQPPRSPPPRSPPALHVQRPALRPPYGGSYHYHRFWEPEELLSDSQPTHSGGGGCPGVSGAVGGARRDRSKPQLQWFGGQWWIPGSKKAGRAEPELPCDELTRLIDMVQAREAGIEAEPEPETLGQSLATTRSHQADGRPPARQLRRARRGGLRRKSMPPWLRMVPVGDLQRLWKKHRRLEDPDAATGFVSAPAAPAP
eukprot:TRINITY_DN5245_c0_g1_i1.p1 TRINITY_DN5245_c0_g1~~TRINITY_DN5245_c0_g1_i1.p1  ORF type:complete len:828 (+),score=306.36 TRINITY_DN5245_c0_g1_i1:57-2486(+)